MTDKFHLSSWFNESLIDPSTGGVRVSQSEENASPFSAVKTDPAGRARSSQITTLFDGKTLDVDGVRIWETLGTGANTFSVNKMQMAVAAGQYCIRRGRYKTPYGAGKPQLIEFTLDNFDTDVGTVKRVGYFSSSSVAPYTANLDGFFMENDSGAVSIKAYRNGTLTMNVPFTSWTNYALLAGYDFAEFTVGFFDFLWLGGTALRLFLKTPSGFILAHEEPWASLHQDTFIASPNHSVRYELRSTTGSGNMSAICSQVATEGDVRQIGKSVCLPMGASVPVTGSTSIYAIKGIKLRADRPSVVIKLTSAAAVKASQNDFGVILVYRNPALSAALTYANAGNVQQADANGTQLVTGGDIVAASASTESGVIDGLEDSFLSFIGSSIAGVSDEYVLAYMPVSATAQSVRGVLCYKEF